jgi:hypothetical protein
MKKLLFSIILALLIINCSSDDSTQTGDDSTQTGDDGNTGDTDLEVTIDFNIEKYIYDTDSEEIRTHIKWAILNNDYPYQYFLYEGHGATELNDYYSNGNGSEAVTLLELSSNYTIKVNADIDGAVLTQEYRFTTPALQEFDGLFLELDINYVGYTAINYSISGLNSNLLNEFFLNEYDFFYGTPLYTNFYQSELQLSNLPINYAHIEGDFFYNLDIIVYKNNILGVKNNFPEEIESRKLYKLPEDDFDALIYNIQDSSVDVIASNSSVINIYSPSNNGPEDFKVYLNNDLIGEYQCFWDGSSGSESFPTIDNLLPNNTYTLKVEVDYDNEPVNTNYEPDLELTTFREFEFTTYSVPLASELDVNIINLTSTSFDFTWRTDLSGLYNCSHFEYDYNFILEIDGVENQTFDTSSRLINVANLNSNTNYSIKLTCNFYFVENNNIVETRIYEFEITTLE